MSPTKTKDILETKLLRFDFADELEDGATISTFTVTIEVLQGTDPASAAVLSGAPVQSGTQVLQRVTAGVEETVYHLRARAVDNSGLAHVIAGNLRVTRL